MGLFRPLRTALCVYECLRLVFIIGAFLVLQPEGTAAFPMLALITPGALFLLMMLFWRLDDSRYQVYGHLYLAGKGLGIITTLFWLFHERSSIMVMLLFGRNPVFIVLGIVSFLVLGDAFSMILAAGMTGLVNTVVKFFSGGK